MPEEFLAKKIVERRQQQAFRQLRLPEGKTDFCSNDYLGMVTNRLIEKQLAAGAGNEWRQHAHGSKGSRLLAGNYALIERTEASVAMFHKAAAGLIFNSGYDANTGLLSCVPQQGDTVLYDALSHASIRDGIRLSRAQSFPFLHNNINSLEQRLSQASGNIFVVTESVFSMDGDMAPLREIAASCKQHGAHLVVDEAHATGVVGERGEGLVQQLGIQDECFARIHTFGKACGVHGAIVLGSGLLRDYLINFSRQFIYTTALPEASTAAIAASYHIFPTLTRERAHISRLVKIFQSAAVPFEKLKSTTPIQVVIIPGNDAVKSVAHRLQQHNQDVRPILYPSVPKESERLRIVLHAYNTIEEVEKLIGCLNG